MERKFINKSGYCPVLCEEHDILIEYVHPPGTKDYKAISCKCDNSDDCSLNLCPIMIDNAFLN